MVQEISVELTEEIITSGLDDSVIVSQLSGPQYHNTTLGLQGGVVGEYYHLSAAELAALTGAGSTYVNVAGDTMTGVLGIVEIQAVGAYHILTSASNGDYTLRVQPTEGQPSVEAYLALYRTGGTGTVIQVGELTSVGGGFGIRSVEPGSGMGLSTPASSTTAKIVIGGIPNTTSNTPYIQLINAGTSSRVAVSIKAAASQTANLTEWQNSSGTALLRVDAAGDLNAAARDFTINTSRLFVVATNAGELRLTNSRTNGINKNGRFTVESYDTSEEPVMGFIVAATSGSNLIMFGGGSAIANCATSIKFLTGNINTVSGTERMSISNTGVITISGDIDHDGTNIGFYSKTPIAQQTGVPVTAVGIHAALVNLGLITA